MHTQPKEEGGRNDKMRTQADGCSASLNTIRNYNMCNQKSSAKIALFTGHNNIRGIFIVETILFKFLIRRRWAATHLILGGWYQYISFSHKIVGAQSHISMHLNARPTDAKYRLQNNWNVRHRIPSRVAIAIRIASVCFALCSRSVYYTNEYSPTIIGRESNKLTYLE